MFGNIRLKRNVYGSSDISATEIVVHWIMQDNLGKPAPER